MKLLIVDDHTILREGVALAGAHADLDAIPLDLAYPAANGLLSPHLVRFRTNRGVIVSSSEDPSGSNSPTLRVAAPSRAPLRVMPA